MEEVKAKKVKLSGTRGDVPSSKTELTQAYMLEYVIAQHPEDKKWFGQLIMDNQKEMVNHLTGAKYMGVDLAVVRAAFAEKYFPSLNVKKDYTKDKKSYLDMVKELCFD